MTDNKITDFSLLSFLDLIAFVGALITLTMLIGGNYETYGWQIIIRGYIAVRVGWLIGKALKNVGENL